MKEYSQTYWNLETLVDNEYDLVNYCDIDRINDLSRISERIADAFKNNEITMDERDKLDKFVWKILRDFTKECICESIL
jgi:hypothetical protein